MKDERLKIEDGRWKIMETGSPVKVTTRAGGKRETGKDFLIEDYKIIKKEMEKIVRELRELLFWY